MLTAEERGAMATWTAIRVMKANCKVDAIAVRQEKEAVRLGQRLHGAAAGAAQQHLVRTRQLARARHIVYGLLRGHAWVRMERNHPDGDDRLKHAITLVWRELAGSVPGLVAPASVQAWLL